MLLGNFAKPHFVNFLEILSLQMPKFSAVKT